MPMLRPLAPIALLLAVGLGGCHAYDMRATNTTSQDVRISLHKGKRHKEISTVVLAPGASVGWSGQTQRPVLLRVGSGPGTGDSTEVLVPRRVHTDLDIAMDAGALQVFNAETGEPVGVCCIDGTCPECEAARAEAAAAEQEEDEAIPADPQHEDANDNADGADDQPAVDLVEPEDD
ncbi:MAG TPA: hypothetical protein VFF69_04845 [Phycisphaerales bacterium]|nr:hypothetical protein [Phycisphaerales bacterium]